MTIAPERWEVPPAVKQAAARVPLRLGDVDLVEQVLARYVGGVPRSEISETCHVYRGTISTWVRHAQVQRTFIRPRRLTDEEIQRTVDAFHEARSMRGAGAILGCTEKTVRKRLRRHAPDVLDESAGDFRPKSGDPALDVEPLAELLDQRVAAGVLISKLAESAGLPERRINAIRNREYKTVRLSTADRLCMAVGEPLAILYPLESDPELAAA